MASTVASSIGTSVSNLFNGSTDPIGDLANLISGGITIASPYLNQSTQKTLGQVQGGLGQLTQADAAYQQQTAALIAAQQAALNAQQKVPVGGSNETLVIGGIGLLAVLILFAITEHR